MIPETGRRFGPYEIQSRLGGGGMGHVFRAWDARLHREVAIKLLNLEYAMPGMRERFLREARAASALNHPNICTVFDIGEQDGDPYLVMELLQGETLKDRIQSRGMSVAEIVSIARETAEALGAAHSKGVVHRDVKPANIFLVEKPNGGIQAKVLDFGLAKIEGGSRGARGRSLDLTTMGATVGTLAYMSPEQARGEVLDLRSDLFSFGVVMYEMATRQVPFQGATSALVFVQLLNHPPEPVREWNEAVPRELEKIILKLLAKERTARFQTARELELALIALSEKGSGGWLRKAVATVPLVRVPDPVARDRRLNRTVSSKSNRPAMRASDDGVERPGDGSPVPPSAGRADGDDVLRPVARLPRFDGRSQPERRQVLRDGAVERRVASGEDGLRGEAPPVPAPIVPEVVTEPPLLAVAEALPIPASVPEEEPVLHLPERARSGEARFPTLFTPSVQRRFRLPFAPMWLGIGAIGIIAGALLLYVILNRGHFGAVTLNAGDALVVTEIENHTGESQLNDSVAEELRLGLGQTKSFHVIGVGAYQSAVRVVSAAFANALENQGELRARRVAARLGAKAYGYGAISDAGAKGGAPYVLRVTVRDVSSNAVVGEFEAQADGVERVPAAVDEMVDEMRQALGESRASIDNATVAVEHEGSANLAAVQWYAHAELLVAGGDTVAAVAELEQAVALDARFVAAYRELATLYARLHAELAAGEASRRALVAADGTSERQRTLAQATYEVYATGDLVRATSLLRGLTTNDAHDPEGFSLLAQTLLEEGRMGAALQMAQQAYALDAFDGRAYHVAESALAGLDRFDAAFQLDGQAQRLGVARPEDTLMVASLDRRTDVVKQLMAQEPEGGKAFRGDWTYGVYLDSEGRMTAGAALWRERARAARQGAGLRSAATFLLAQGALDRALTGDCKSAKAMLTEAGDGAESGRDALFNAAMTEALCGEASRAEAAGKELGRRFPQSFAVKSFYLPDLQAALDLRGGNPGMALEALRPARAYDLVSLTAYLRGMAHTAMRQVEVGIVDFQTVLSHRGLTFLVGNTVYPAAQLGVARAFQSAGNTSNSTASYAAFVLLWSDADGTSPGLVEAKARINGFRD